MAADSFAVSGDPGSSVCEIIAPDEGMMVRTVSEAEAREHYFSCGRSALRCVQAALAAAEKKDIRRILDFPSGHGRVLRVLKAAFPIAELHACDLLVPGIEFCQKQFGAVALRSDPDPARVQLRGPYDLIWVGSLFTHLDAKRWPGFLKLFHDALAPGGVCVFTTHGFRSANWIGTGVTDYGLKNAANLLPAFKKTGFSYRDYEATGYGISLSSPSWVLTQLAALPEARIVLALERGWSDHQDAFAWQKA